ncbi:hypothetical protein ACIQK6_39975, partial [Streptomyces sp. NPDC091682]
PSPIRSTNRALIGHHPLVSVEPPNHPKVNGIGLNRIEAQFTALRYFALDGTDHASHREQGSMIRRYIIWRNKHAQDERLRSVVSRANIA